MEGAYKEWEPNECMLMTCASYVFLHTVDEVLHATLRLLASTAAVLLFGWFYFECSVKVL